MKLKYVGQYNNTNRSIVLKYTNNGFIIIFWNKSYSPYPIPSVTFVSHSHCYESHKLL